MQKLILGLQGDEIPVISFVGAQAVSQIDHYIIDVLFNNNDKTLWDSTLGQPVVLSLDSLDLFSGIITEYLQVGDSADQQHSIIRFTVQSQLAKLTLNKQIRLFLHQTIKQVISELLQNNGIHRFQWHVTSELSSKPYRLQGCDESDFDLLCRLVSRAGIYFYSEIDDNGNEQIIFRDNSTLAPTLPGIDYIKPHTTQIASHTEFEPHVFALNLQRNEVAQSFYSSDHVAEASQQAIVAQQTELSQPNGLGHNVFHQGNTTSTDASRHVSLLQQAAKAQQEILKGKSNSPTLKIAHCIYINCENLNTAWSKSYFITHLQHKMSVQQQFTHYNLNYWQDFDEPEHSTQLVAAQTAYQNQFNAIPSTTPYRSTIMPLPQVLPFMSATVESELDTAQLDQQGRVHLRPHFDQSNVANTKALPNIKQAQSHLNPNSEEGFAVGQHLPLTAQTEVLIAHENGDPDRLFVVNSLPNKHNATPVNSNNFTENTFKTTGGHTIVMNDAKQQHIMRVQTADGMNHLTMNGTDDQHHIQLHSELGSIHTKADTNQFITTQQDLINTADNKFVNVKQHIDVATKHDDIQLQSQQHTHMNAREDINLNSGGDYQLLSAANMTINAKQNAHYMSQQGDLVVKSQNGQVIIHSKTTCELLGNGNDEIHIRNGNAGYQITPNGEVNIYGKNIAFNSAQQVQLKGKVNYQKSGTVPKAPASKNSNAINPVGNIVVQPDATHQTKLDFIQFQFSLPQQHTMPYINQTRYKLNTNMGEGSISTLFDKTITGVIEQFQANISNIDLDNPWFLQLEGTAERKAMYIIAVNNKACKPTRVLYAKPGQYPTASKNMTSTNSIMRTQTVHVTLLPLPMNFNMLLYSKQHLQRMLQRIPAQFQIKKMQQLTKSDWQQIDSTLNYFSDKFQDNDPNLRRHLTDDEIKFIKATGNNVVIFLHGYNVPYGEYSNAFDLTAEPSNHSETAFYQAIVNQPTIDGVTDTQATIWRDPQHNILQSYTNGSEFSSERDDINGSGTHNWWLEISNNLNLATNQFHYNDYTKYNHVIGVSWQGCPSPENFMADRTTGRYTGMLVASLIKQLHLAGIKTNVVSHSMGAMVLLSAMSYLAQDGQNKTIEHAMLWEPAVPDFALSDQQHPSDPDGKWFFPKATDAANKITVLYSNNDNILGPIPANQKNQAEINATKPVSELLTALILTKMEMGSVYDMAAWAGVPVDALFHGDNINQVYNDWIRQHPLDKQGNPFALTLHQQMENNKNESSDFYHGVVTKLNGIYPEVIADLRAAGHTGLADSMQAGRILYNTPELVGSTFLLPMLEIMVNIAVDIGLMSTLVQKLFTLLDVIFVKSTYNPTQALGYVGPDLTDNHVNKLFKSYMLSPVPQSKWLWSHSAMRVPSKDLMYHVYKQYIIGPKGIQQFGEHQV